MSYMSLIWHQQGSDQIAQNGCCKFLLVPCVRGTSSVDEMEDAAIFLCVKLQTDGFLRQLPHMLQDAEFRQGIAALMARHHVATRSKQSKPAGITEKGSIHVISCLACETQLVTSAYILCFFPCCDLLY